MKVQLGNKSVTIRKWKGKDKKEFLAAFKKEDIKQEDVMNALVYSCIEEDVVLSPEEFKYILSRIRAYSLGEDFEIEFYCDNCGSLFKRQFKLNETVRGVSKELKEINVKGVNIKLGDIRNKDFYIKQVAIDEAYDFLLRVQEINGNDTFTLQELEDIIDNLDIDVLTDIMQIYEEHRFKVDDINIIKCDCGKETKYKFDEIPGFLPDGWFL